MVLFPISAEPRPQSEPVPVWQAIERRQTMPAAEWWLIAQPDHASLAGDIARQLTSADLPPLDEEVIQAIALHDEGWAGFDGEVHINRQRRPMSFLEAAPPDFVAAWLGSIERAAAVGPVAGILVSEHFCRLGKFHLQRVQDSTPDARLITSFLASEAKRRSHLEPQQRRSREELMVLVDVLQFCDLVSLYLCSGCNDSVDFPQTFNGHCVRLRRKGGLHRLEPGLFAAGVGLAVPVRHYPASPGSGTLLPFLLE